jgi:hypothetical protein
LQIYIHIPATYAINYIHIPATYAINYIHIPATYAINYIHIPATYAINLYTHTGNICYKLSWSSRRVCVTNPDPTHFVIIVLFLIARPEGRVWGF